MRAASSTPTAHTVAADGRMAAPGASSWRLAVSSRYSTWPPSRPAADVWSMQRWSWHHRVEGCACNSSLCSAPAGTLCTSAVTILLNNAQGCCKAGCKTSGACPAHLHHRRPPPPGWLPGAAHQATASGVQHRRGPRPHALPSPARQRHVWQRLPAAHTAPQPSHCQLRSGLPAVPISPHQRQCPGRGQAGLHNSRHHVACKHQQPLVLAMATFLLAAVVPVCAATAAYQFRCCTFLMQLADGVRHGSVVHGCCVCVCQRMPGSGWEARDRRQQAGVVPL
jgi:hypothetical protein